MMILAVLAGAVIYMVSGMVYYTVPGNRWVDLLNIKNPEQPNYRLLSFVTLLTSLILFGLIRFSGAETFTGGDFAGLLTGLIVSLAYSKNFIFGLGTSTERAPCFFDRGWLSCDSTHFNWRSNGFVLKSHKKGASSLAIPPASE